MIALPWLIVTVAPLIAWALLFGLRQSWAQILKAIKAYLSSPNILQRIFDPFHISSQPKVHQGEKTLGDEALQAEPTTAGFVAGLAGLVEFNAFTIKYIARDTLAALEGLVGHTIPVAVGARTRTTRQHAEAANQRARQAARVAAAAAAAAFAGLRLWGHAAGHAQVTANKALAKAQAIAIPAPGVIARERVQAKSTASERKYTRWLRRIALALGIGSLAGLVVKVLVRQLPWFRCANVNRTMRQLCRTPYHFLSDLLALTADFFILTNICRVIPWLEAAFAEVGGPLISKLAGVGAGLCGAGYEPAAPLASPPLHLPAVAGHGTLYIP
jgi:hypothetical protein